MVTCKEIQLSLCLRYKRLEYAALLCQGSLDTTVSRYWKGGPAGPGLPGQYANFSGGNEVMETKAKDCCCLPSLETVLGG